MRIIRALLVAVIAMVGAALAASQARDIVDRARALYPPLQGAGEPSRTLLPGQDSTALGCELLAGLPLPDPLDVYRLEFQLDGGVFAVHVSADGSLAQACDERLPNLGAGTQLVQRAGADSDGDGRPDAQDDCPYIAGVADGCPRISTSDRDGDGVADSADRCSGQAGPVAADGCALLADADRDGVPDHIDICAEDIGPYRADFAPGCPTDGSGSSARRRGSEDACTVLAADAPLRASSDASSAAIGNLAHVESRAVIGRSAAGDWLQLAAGWVALDRVGLQGACYNIPLVNAAAGGATGCFLRPLGDFVNVRQGPGGAVVTRLADGARQAVLGRNFAGDWLMFRAGWVSRDAVELSGSCERLPALDPALAGSGIIHFCPPGFRGFLPPRVSIGGGPARVVSETLANRLRAQPSIEARQIGEIAPRRKIDAVLDGPACNGPWVWWQVEFEGLVGWTVESDVNYNYYYLEPVADAARVDEARRTLADAALPASGQLIHSGNLDALQAVASLPVKAPIALAWSPQGSQLAALSEDGRVALFPAADFRDQESRVLAGAASALAFSPDGRWLALGDMSGKVRLLETQGGSVAVDARHIGQLAGPIRALAWSGAGDKLAAVSGAEELKLARRAGILQVWLIDAAAPENSRLTLHQHFPYPLTALAFSGDDRWLAVTGESSSAGRAALWVYAADSGELQLAQPLIPLGSHSSVVAAPGGSLGDFVFSSGDGLYQLAASSGVSQRVYHQAGAQLKRFVFRPQVLAGAEALLALAVETPDGAARLQVWPTRSAHLASAPNSTLRPAPSPLARTGACWRWPIVKATAC